MTLMNAIYNRRSIRKYKNESISELDFDKLNRIIESCPSFYPNISFKTNIIKDGSKIHKLFSGIISNYTKVVAPHYLIITSEISDGYLENVGYSMEHLVLELTSLGIGTCWIGGFDKNADLTELVPDINKQKPVIVIAFGYPIDPSELTEIIPESYKRKDLTSLFLGNIDDSDINILNAIRRAPSGINGQPCRISKENNIFNFHTVKRNFLTKSLEPMNRVDAGIALYHLKVAAESENKNIEFFLTKNTNRNDLNYIISAKLS